MKTRRDNGCVDWESSTALVCDQNRVEAPTHIHELTNNRNPIIDSSRCICGSCRSRETE